MHWNSNMRSHLKASELYIPNEKELNELRKLGFTSAHLAPDGGIYQGHSSLININKKPKISVANPGIINIIAPRATAAPEIISLFGDLFSLICEKLDFNIFNPSNFA